MMHTIAFSSAGLSSRLSQPTSRCTQRLSKDPKAVMPVDVWRQKPSSSGPKFAVNAVSPAGVIPSFSPPVGSAAAGQGTTSSDMVGLLMMGAFAGLCGAQLFGPSKHNAAACQLGAAMGAASVALFPSALAHLPGSLALTGAALGAGNVLVRPLLAKDMSRADAQAWAVLSAVALALVGLAAQQTLTP